MIGVDKLSVPPLALIVRICIEFKSVKLDLEGDKVQTHHNGVIPKFN